MPTYNVAASPGIPARGQANIAVIKQIVDFDALYKTVDAFGNIVWNKPVAADVVNVLNVNANTQILYFGARCINAPTFTAVGSLLTVTFGASSGTIAGTFDQTATAGSLKPATVTAGLVAVGTALTATMTTITTMVALGKWEFYAVFADLN